MNTIITIGRQYGSGGREIGAKIAERFGIPFYDNALIQMAAKESGFSEKYFYDAGALARSMFGLFSYPYMFYMALRTKKRSDLSFAKKIKMLYAGYSRFGQLMSFEEYKQERNFKKEL